MYGYGTFSTEQIRGGNERNEEEPSKDGIGDSAGSGQVYENNLYFSLLYAMRRLQLLQKKDDSFSIFDLFF